MSYMWFAVRRSLLSGLFITVLVVLLLSVCGAAALGGEVFNPLCGIVNEDGGETSELLMERLVSRGFVTCADWKEVCELVEDGTLDCGIAICPGLDARMRAVDLHAAARSVQSPTSALAGFYRGIVGAQIFRFAAPYITAQVLSELGVTDKLEETQSYFGQYFEGGPSFTFQIFTVEGVKIGGVDYADSFMKGAVAILLFAALFFGTYDSASRDLRSFAPRLGARTTMRSIVMPVVICQTTLVLLSLAAALLAAALVFDARAAAALLIPTAIYSVVLTNAGLLLALLLPHGERLKLILPFWLLISLLLCPIYADLSALLPVLKFFHVFLPPYWFYEIAAQPVPWAVAAVTLAALSPLAFKAVCIRRYKYLWSSAVV